MLNLQLIKKINKMKKSIIKIIAVLALLASIISCKGEQNETKPTEAKEVAVVENAQEFIVNTATSTLEWIGSEPGKDHTGNISIEKGTVNILENEITGSFVIDMTSINVTDLEGKKKEGLEAHLKGTAKPEQDDHFFNVVKYPTAAFEITGVTEKDGKKMMQGNLSIRDKKQNIEFPVTYNVEGDTMTLSSETFTIDRTQWGVNYGSQSVFDNLGDNFINDDIQITIKLSAKKA